MGRVIILPETTKNPITLIGHRAGVCTGADTTNEEKNYKRGIDCIKSEHGRALEYVDIHAVFDGYSARVVREYYTHIGGSPTRLQASTRYIDYSNFDCVIPNSVLLDQVKLTTFEFCLNDIKKHMKTLLDMGVPREDVALLLPMGYTTKFVDKRNLRNIIDMSHQRECKRANWEYRQLFYDYKEALKEYSDEWVWLVDNLFMPKCQFYNRCNETRSCGWFKVKDNNGEV